MAQRSLDLIEAMRDIAEAAQPITGRGVGYKLFTRGLIASMARSEMARVYRLLLKAREQGIIPWDWIVDETRELERVSTWDDPEQYARAVARSYRRDFWNQQPHPRRGLVREGHRARRARAGARPLRRRLPGRCTASPAAPSSTTSPRMTTAATLIVLYVGDFDPSGMFMSEEDLPKRFAKYGGDHITLQRIALTRPQVRGLPSFPAADKSKDPRYKWFVANHGHQCWELDAMDPNDLRDCVEREIKKLIEPVAWQRCEVVNKAEQESLKTVLERWNGVP